MDILAGGDHRRDQYPAELDTSYIASSAADSGLSGFFQDMSGHSSYTSTELCDEIQDIRNGSRILHIGEDLIYVANVAAH